MNIKKQTITYFMGLSILFFSACKKDKKETIITTDNKGAIILNEGGFGKSNASIGVYKKGDNSYQELFQSANGRPLGDVLQSATIIDDKLYIVVNNSNKIEVVNLSDFKSVTTITINQPRNIIKIGNGKAYVTQLNNIMSVLDLTSNTVIDSVNLKHSSDNIFLMNNVVYVTQAFANKIFTINATTHTVTDSLVVANGVSNFASAGSNKLALFCTGLTDWNTGNVIENGSIIFINKDSLKAESTIKLNTGSYGGSMVNYDGNLYFTFGDKNIHKIAETATTNTSAIHITYASTIYGFNINPSNGELYLTDAVDYASAGNVYLYDKNATLLNQFSAGIVPSKIVFNP